MDCMLHCGSVEVEVGVGSFGRVESSELVTKTEPCLSERTGKHIQSRASGSVKLGLCRAPSCEGVSFTVAMALSCPSCADESGR